MQTQGIAFMMTNGAGMDWTVTRDLDRQISDIRTKLEVRDLHTAYALRSIADSLGGISSRLKNIEARLDKPKGAAALMEQGKILLGQTWIKVVLILLAAGGNQWAVGLLQGLLK